VGEIRVGEEGGRGRGGGGGWRGEQIKSFHTIFNKCSLHQMKISTH